EAVDERESVAAGKRGGRRAVRVLTPDRPEACCCDFGRAGIFEWHESGRGRTAPRRCVAGTLPGRGRGNRPPRGGPASADASGRTRSGTDRAAGRAVIGAATQGHAGGGVTEWGRRDCLRPVAAVQDVARALVP